MLRRLHYPESFATEFSCNADRQAKHCSMQTVDLSLKSAFYSIIRPTSHQSVIESLTVERNQSQRVSFPCILIACFTVSVAFDLHAQHARKRLRRDFVSIIDTSADLSLAGSWSHCRKPSISPHNKIFVSESRTSTTLSTAITSLLLLWCCRWRACCEQYLQALSRIWVGKLQRECLRSCTRSYSQPVIGYIG